MLHLISSFGRNFRRVKNVLYNKCYSKIASDLKWVRNVFNTLQECSNVQNNSIYMYTSVQDGNRIKLLFDFLDPCRSEHTLNMTEWWRKDSSGSNIIPFGDRYNCDSHLFNNIQWFR